MVRELAETLQRDGFAASQIHGDMEQAERLRELDRFKAGEINILVASDVAARGLDIKGVSHVFNFDVPWHPDDYVHRIGRTGRAGATGKAFTLMTPDDAEAIDAIEKLTSTKIPRVAGGDAPAADAPAEVPRRGTAASARGRKPRRDDRPAPSRATPGASTAREPRPAREERTPTRRAEPRRRRDERAGPAARSRAEARAATSARHRAVTTARDDRPPAREPELPALETADGWNGPIPGFLDYKLRS